MSQGTVNTLDEPPREQLVREHERLLTTLKNIRIVAKAAQGGEYGYSYGPYKQIVAAVNDAIGS